MLEKVYAYKKAEGKLIERIISDGNLDLNHMILPKGTDLPQHFSNSNVYMIVIRGTMTIQLASQEPRKYEAGKIIDIPYDIKMHVTNSDEEILEFFVVKAPSPKSFGGK